MGQQQLLLLVLATVIVGLATVAGIQAFDEGRTQATQDALQQRALAIGSDVYAATEKPDQLGGVSLDSDKSSIAAAAGFGSSATGIPAEGAGSSADCDITSTDPVKIICADDGSGSGNSDSDASTNQSVVVEVDSEGPSVTSINNNTVGS
jgi:hypothetical protein